MDVIPNLRLCAGNVNNLCRVGDRRPGYGLHYLQASISNIGEGMTTDGADIYEIQDMALR